MAGSAAADPESAGKGKPVLVVDDDLPTLMLASEILDREGYRTLTTPKPTDVLDMVRRYRPRVILLDINMPDMDGLTLLRHLRKITFAPVLMLTGDGKPDTVVRSLKLGAIDYLTKPIRREKLLEAMCDALEKSAEMENPARLGDYEIAEEIGRGGMGLVYRAKDLSLDRWVALKVILPEYTTNATHRNRFRNEARAAARVTHPGLVTIYQVGSHEERLFLAMELVAGQPLSRMLAEYKRISPTETVRILLRTGEAVSAIHRAGMVHRDLKPSNLMIEKNLGVKILDFGLAGFWAELNSAGPGEYIMGTPGYISPEAILGTPVDARTDIYSLGLIAYEMLAGKPAYPMQMNSRTLDRITGGKPEVPLRDVEGVSPALAEVVERMMNAKPARRYETMDDCIRELKKIFT